MARNIPIDRDEVIETANRLEAEGKEVTALTMLSTDGKDVGQKPYGLLTIYSGWQPLLFYYRRVSWQRDCSDERTITGCFSWGTILVFV